MSALAVGFERTKEGPVTSKFARFDEMFCLLSGSACWDFFWSAGAGVGTSVGAATAKGALVASSIREAAPFSGDDTSRLLVAGNVACGVVAEAFASITGGTSSTFSIFLSPKVSLWNPRRGDLHSRG